MFQNQLKKFRDFAIKGNVVDMAIGIVIGASFGKIATSLVNDIIMPPIGLLLRQGRLQQPLRQPRRQNLRLAGCGEKSRRGYL